MGEKRSRATLLLLASPTTITRGPNLAGIDPNTRKRTWLFHPRRNKWKRHFQWEGPILVGRTAMGRVTIAVLGINLEYRVRHRSQLVEEGVFPTEDIA
jgi:hypothetical protein